MRYVILIGALSFVCALAIGSVRRQAAIDHAEDQQFASDYFFRLKANQ